MKRNLDFERQLDFEREHECVCGVRRAACVDPAQHEHQSLTTSCISDELQTEPAIILCKTKATSCGNGYFDPPLK